MSTHSILLYIIFLLSPGDSSLRFGMTIYYFTGGGERSGDSLKDIEKDKIELANRHFFPPIPQSRHVIPSASEESPVPWSIYLQLFRQMIEESPIPWSIYLQLFRQTIEETPVT